MIAHPVDRCYPFPREPASALPSVGRGQAPVVSGTHFGIDCPESLDSVSGVFQIVVLNQKRVSTAATQS